MRLPQGFWTFGLLKGHSLGGPPHPVAVAVRDDSGYLRALLYSYSSTVTGLGGPPTLPQTDMEAHIVPF